MNHENAIEHKKNDTYGNKRAVANGTIKILVCLAVFWNNIFDFVLMLSGGVYAGLDESNSLVITSLVVLAGVMVVYIWGILKSMKFRLDELCFFAAMAIFFILYMMTGDRIFGNPFNLIKYMRKSVVYCLICLLSFFIIRREGWYGTIFKVIKVYAVCGGAIISYRMMPQLLKNWQSVEYFGSLWYQAMGYLCSGISILLLTYIIVDKNIWHRLIYSAFALTTFAAIILTGARGAMIAFIFVASYVVVMSFKPSLKNALILCLISMALFFAGYLLVCRVPFISEFINGASRTFNYLEGGGISLENREGIFKDAIALIKEKPIAGYGFGASYYLLGIYPHNMFLEFMMDGGIIYTVIISVILFYRLLKWTEYFKACKDIRIVLVMILVNLSMLMLSGSYYFNPWFWLLVFFGPINHEIKGC